MHPFLEGVWGLFGSSCSAAALSCQAFSSTPVGKSLWDRQEVAMTTMFVLWLVGRLLQQQLQRVVSTVEEGAPPLSLPQGCLSSAPKVPRSDVTGAKRGSRGKRRRREEPKISSTNLSLRTVSRGQASASPSTQTDFPMRSDAPHPTRWMTAVIVKSVKQTQSYYWPSWHHNMIISITVTSFILIIQTNPLFIN